MSKRRKRGSDPVGKARMLDRAYFYKNNTYPNEYRRPYIPQEAGEGFYPCVETIVDGFTPWIRMRTFIDADGTPFAYCIDPERGREDQTMNLIRLIIDKIPVTHREDINLIRIAIRKGAIEIFKQMEEMQAALARGETIERP